jgi:outer membrane protein TolC
VLYSIREFTQYRKGFAIDIATQYYQTLQSRDAARNAYVVYTAFKNTLVQQAALADANRPGKTQSALGLLQQAELNYHRRWISAVRSYEENLDSLKLDLAIPVTEPLMLDQREMDKLTLIDPPGTLDDALAAAMTTRLDLWNARDSRDDAARRIKVAQRDLLPGLGIVGDYNLKGDKTDGLNLDKKRRDYSVGLDLDLHLDQKPERNNLRSAQIALQRAERTLELAEENVRKDVRSSWRSLDLARKQYDIAQEGLKLSEVRLERERAMFEVDRGNSRDLIDAQQALNDARDQRIAALVNHTIARIDLWKNMGVLFIRKDGSWADVLAKETPKGQGS